MSSPRAVAPVIVSTTLAAGRGEDRVTPLIRDLARRLGYSCLDPRFITDGEEVGAALSQLLDQREIQVILTSGGTGVTPDDLTPEHTAPLSDKHLPGVMEAIRAYGRTKTPLAALSRGVAGVSGSTVIVNLPGSPSAVADAADILSELLPHLCDQAADLRPTAAWKAGHDG